MRRYRLTAMTPKIDKTPITNAFKELRKLGYFARQNFMCCQSCGWAAIPEEKQDKAVFYHAQDNAKLLNPRNHSCYLSWSGNGEEIVEVLKKHGLTVTWDGDENTRIQISPLPKG